MNTYVKALAARRGPDENGETNLDIIEMDGLVVGDKSDADVRFRLARFNRKIW